MPAKLRCHPCCRKPRPLVLGHRGYRSRYPENTTVSFAAAITHGADGVELDVQKTADGSYVVVHDPPRPDDRLPLLSEVLSGLPRGSFIDVELKADTLAPADCPRILAEIIAARVDPDHFFVSSFEPALLGPWKAWGIATGLLLGEEAARLGPWGLLRRLRILQPSWLCVPVQAFGLLGRRRARCLLRLARLFGLKLAFWTLTAASEFTLVQGIADAVIADDVQIAVACLGRRR